MTPGEVRPDRDAFSIDGLVRWSQGRLPLWQQHALRRILKAGFPTDDDIEELALMSLQVEDDGSSGDPIQGPAVPAKRGVDADEPLQVSLLSISQIRHVNALGEGPVTFAGQGLSVLYGENGSGKSGIARILRQTCTARAGQGDVHPNVFSMRPTEPQEATISFTVNGEEKIHTWTPGVDPDPDLQTVHVFDSESAGIWVSSDNRVSYSPWPVTVLSRLAEACLAVGNRLRSEKAALEDSKLDRSGFDLRPGTAASEVVSALHARTPDGVIADACTVSEAEKQRLAELEKALQDDPAAKASDLKAKRRRILAIQESLGRIDRDLGDESMARLKHAWHAADRAARAASGARGEVQRHAVLPGVGESAWRRMWDAASGYSTAIAYPGASFPELSTDALCVLCQQQLQDEARTRMERFERFMGGEVQRRAEELRSALLTEWELVLGHELQKPTRITVDDVGFGDQQLAYQVRCFLLGAEQRRRQVLRASTPDTLSNLRDLPASPSLTAVLESIDQDISNLEEASKQTGREALVRERDELKDKTAIAPQRDALFDERERLRRVEALNRALATVNAHRITRKHGDAHRALVTHRLQDGFKRRLLALGFSELPVDVILGEGRQGDHPVGLAIDAELDVPPHYVLSEGERTAVALAGLLAELDMQGNTSALVLDDPVTSLDHNYRERVALVLASEAKRRQVVVLTHDVVFLALLERYAKQSSLGPQILTVARGKAEGGHGNVSGEQPWETLKVKDQVAALRQQMVEARRLRKRDDVDAYDDKVRGVYERLREAWERAVEEVLLGGVVTRFDVAVHTQALRSIGGDVHADDAELVATEMARCSTYTHDTPPAARARVPGPDVVEQDLRTLADWSTKVRKRRERKPS